jgi:flagellar basal-body rod modification protein FlgD
MDNISDTMNSLSFKQSPAEMFKTKMETQTINKSLKSNGKEPIKVMGKDEFLKLLITQLEHQDPTNPMEDRDFLAQMAQFSSLEQMLTLNTNVGKMANNMTFQSSFDLLGKEVEIQSEDKTDDNGNLRTVKGMVQAISKSGDDTVVMVNGENYPVANILKVEQQ